MTSCAGNPHFLLQNDFEAFGELIKASNLPVFTSSYYLRDPNIPNDGNRVVIPILDQEADVRYYLACSLDDKKRFGTLFKRIS